MKCPSCGAEVPQTKFCTECGARLSENKAEISADYPVDLGAAPDLGGVQDSSLFYSQEVPLPEPIPTPDLLSSDSLPPPEPLPKPEAASPQEVSPTPEPFHRTAPVSPTQAFSPESIPTGESPPRVLPVKQRKGPRSGWPLRLLCGAVGLLTVSFVFSRFGASSRYSYEAPTYHPTMVTNTDSPSTSNYIAEILGEDVSSRTAQGDSSSPSAKAGFYVYETGGLQLEMPVHWTKTVEESVNTGEPAADNKSTAFSSTDELENTNIFVQYVRTAWIDFESESAVDLYVETVASNLNSPEILRQETVVIAGRPGVRLHFIDKTLDYPAVMYAFCNGSTLYQLLFGTSSTEQLNAHLADFEAIVASAQLLEDPSAPVSSAPASSVSDTALLSLDDPARVWYDVGSYTVGKDLPAGVYYFEAEKYTHSLSGFGMLEIKGTKRIIDPVYLATTYLFVEVLEGQNIELRRGRLTPGDSVPPIQPESIGIGGYRIGIDLPAGEYLLTPAELELSNYLYDQIPNATSTMEILSDDTSHSLTLTEGQYLEIKNGVLTPQ